MKRLLFCLLLIAPVWAGCDSSSETDVYNITLSDEDGAPVLSGELRLAIEEEGPEDSVREVAGSWRLSGRNGRPDPVPSSGTLRGELSLSGIGLSLDMNASDSGIHLAGTYDGDRIAGEWSSITIAGPMPRGMFEAVQE